MGEGASMGSVLGSFTLEQWLTMLAIPIISGAVMWAWVTCVIAFFDARDRRRQAQLDAILAALDEPVAD